jgi:hypothetical protein
VSIQQNSRDSQVSRDVVRGSWPLPSFLDMAILEAGCNSKTSFLTIEALGCTRQETFQKNYENIGC